MEHKGSLILGCASVAPVSDVNHSYSDPHVYVNITEQQRDDVLSGVLDIGWLFRNLPVHAFDATVYSLDSGLLVPVSHIHRLERIDSDCLPGLDFFCMLDDEEPHKEPTEAEEPTEPEEPQTP